MKLFVWDFHGVLEKDNDKAVLAISNQTLREFGYKEKLTEKECRKLSGLKWFQYFEYLLPAISHKSHIQLQERCFEISNQKPEIVAKYIQVNDYAEFVLETIKGKHQLALISNTKPASLQMYLKVTNLKKYFSESYTIAVDAHKKEICKTKKDFLTNILSQSKDDFEKVVIVGDSPSDMQLTKDISIPTITYLYSHPGRKFRECESDYKINDLREVLKEV